MKRFSLLIISLLLLSFSFAQRVSSTHFFYFESSASNLNSIELKKLNLVCDTLLQNTLISVSITGHTDDTDTEEANLILSEVRAKSVKEFLIKQKISESIISISAMGETNPIELNTNEKGKARNRRVEVKVIYEK
jgi:OOP family OmpA-OmpF porin